MNTAALSQVFKQFADHESRDASPLYRQIALAISHDVDLLRLAEAIPDGQPAPNLFLAAVHFLLLQGYQHPLSDYYRSLTETPRPAKAAYPVFREFCSTYRSSIVQLLRTRRVQTNEVRRSAYLFLALSILGRRLGANRDLAVIEIGASAGLNLLWDKYGYHYPDYGDFGDLASPVQLECIFRGDRRPPLPTSAARMVRRVGLDLHPIDVRNPEEALWLRALVWPEARERERQLLDALELAREQPPKLVQGDGVELLPEAVQNAQSEANVCVFHTFTVNQFSPAKREQLATLLTELARHQRFFFRISVEWISTPHPQLELTIWENGIQKHFLLANCHAHGEWMEWLDTSHL